ncbi:bifunctional oligoribonuclease/PAP phosphatase NrnA [bacterium AH-315-C07]|nr:bifunctional oligoribonuclease/PAP phosphatase NrnA [bacterium AH-315-C07]
MLQELKEALDQPRRIVITTHQKPDGDAIGSSLGLYHYLKGKGHDVVVITPTDYAPNLQFLPDNDQVLDYKNPKNSLKEMAALVKEAEFIFCLDFNQLSRINELGELVEESDGVKILIDHHPDPADFSKYRIHDEKASSTAELIYRFIDEVLSDHTSIDKDIAMCLYTGLVTDTGSFRFPCTSGKVHEIAADLISKGVNIEFIHDKVYDNFSEGRLRFIGYCIGQKMQVFPEYSTALISISQEELLSHKIQTGDTEGLVNYPLSIEGITFSVLIVDRTELIKMSFRSKGDIPANLMANKYFDGGGHKNAAGGSSKLTLEETVTKFMDVLPGFISSLKI